jgi:hypothetical protein
MVEMCDGQYPADLDQSNANRDQASPHAGTESKDSRLERDETVICDFVAYTRVYDHLS